MAADYDINFIPAIGSSTLIEYRKEGETVWIVPSSPSNPTSLFTYPISLDDDSVYYVRVSSISTSCSKKSRIVYIDTSSVTGTTTTTTTTTLTPGGGTATVQNNTADGSIQSVTGDGIGGPSFTFIGAGQSATETHSTFTSVITVQFDVAATAATVLKLYRNGIELQSFSILGGASATKVFNSFTYLSTDYILITWT